MELFTQYFRNGFESVARKRKRLLCKIKVVIFQLIIKTAAAIPVIAAPPAFTFPGIQEQGTRRGLRIFS